jgi:hypothetical protein
MEYEEYPEGLDRDFTTPALDRITSKFADLDAIKEKFGGVHVCLGVDGYVDSLYSLVATRRSADEFDIMGSMNTFAQWVLAAAGSSCNIERVLKKLIGGGFGPNTARAVATLGASVDLIGALGKPDEVFINSLPSNVSMHSLNDPGSTCALEFDDGKVMLTDFANINGITWDHIQEKLGRDQVIDMLEKADAIGQGHWSLVSHLSEIWHAWAEEIFPSLSQKNRYFYVDVADMTKRTPGQIKGMIKELEGINAIPGCKAVMSCNDKEAIQISQVLDDDCEIATFTDYYTNAEKMMAHMDISMLVFHSPYFAMATTKDAMWHVREAYTSKPKFTTAAGDHFNGGCLVALASGFEPDEALLIANATTAHFVRTGQSPSVDLVSAFLGNYQTYLYDDIDSII